MRPTAPQRRLLSEEVSVVYNYDQVLIGRKGDKWMLPRDGIVDELGLITKPFTPKVGNYLPLCYEGGKPTATGGWDEWKWSPRTHAINMYNFNKEDRKFLEDAPATLATMYHQKPIG